MHARKSDLGYELAPDSFKQVRAAENVDDDIAVQMILIVQGDGSKGQFIDYILLFVITTVKDRLLHCYDEYAG